MVQSTYRQLRRDKIAADTSKEKAPTQATTGQQPTPVAVTQATPTKISSDVPLTTAAIAVNAIGGRSSNSIVTLTPVSTVQEQSRKRQLPGPDGKREKKSMRSGELSHSGEKSGAASTEGMSLYERVKAMHDQRVKTARNSAAQPKSPKMSLNQILTQQEKDLVQQVREQAEREKREAKQALQQERDQNCQQEQERNDRLKKEQQQKELQRQEEKQQQEKKQQQEEQRRLEEQRRTQEEKRLQKERRLLEELQRETEKQQREAKRHEEELRQREEQQRQEAKRREEEFRQREEERLREELRKQKQAQEEKKKRLIEEQNRHEKIMRQQEEARRQAEAQLMHEGNRFVSQAQQVLHSQPGYAAPSSSAPPTIPVSVPQTSNNRFTRLPSPVSIPTHAPRFQASPSPSHVSQGFRTQPSHGAPTSSGFSSVGNEHGSQVYQGHTGAPMSRFETISHVHEENHRMVVRGSRQQQQQQSDFSDAMVPHRITGVAASGGFSPSKSGEDDELRAIWVSDYDNVNALVMQLDVEISNRTEEGHSFVHRSNNITIPEQLKLQINNLRAQRDAAIKKRFESVVRVLIFSDAVRSFAQQNEKSNIWSDVPEVQKASHKKCAELASDIREFERQAQKLREGIDEAVSSGNPEQMQNVAHMGALIADLEQKIRASNGERDKQFIFMFQFTNTLRNMVRAEWAASGRSYQLQGSQ
ncbi:Reticulocyte-binding protein 2 a [Phytophthora citrophthora]|uniref:Reticulocyte-binding protein 2 a n=1 Tax=Phytophthora citrophthora TaxID=4793 RepID=A0AAD9LUY4_9STRA|nr:Reticulocyte-binding protein 2 a [Phytophthora citrophthora]